LLKTFAAVPRKECWPAWRWMSETQVYLFKVEN
jgi:hypothetical protein